MLWDLAEGKRLYSLDAGDIIYALTFSPNRYWLCAATQTCIKIWCAGVPPVSSSPALQPICPAHLSGIYRILVLSRRIIGRAHTLGDFWFRPWRPACELKPPCA